METNPNMTYDEIQGLRDKELVEHKCDPSHWVSEEDVDFLNASSTSFLKDNTTENESINWNPNITIAGTKYNFDTSSKDNDHSIANYHSVTTSLDQFDPKIIIFYIPSYSTYASSDGIKVSIKTIANNFADQMEKDGFTLLYPFSFTDPKRPGTDIYVLTSYILRSSDDKSVIFYTVTRQTDLGIFVVLYHKEIENGLNDTSTKQKILEWLNSHTDYLENVNTHFDPSIFLK